MLHTLLITARFRSPPRRRSDTEASDDSKDDPSHADADIDVEVIDPSESAEDRARRMLFARRRPVRIASPTGVVGTTGSPDNATSSDGTIKAPSLANVALDALAVSRSDTPLSRLRAIAPSPTGSAADERSRSNTKRMSKRDEVAL